MEAAIQHQTNQLALSLPDDLLRAVEAALDDWDHNRKVARLWARDPSLWTNQGEDKWLGWLHIADEQQKTIRRFTNFAAEVKDSGFTHLLLLGMGGSSLCPDVLSKSFGKLDGFPTLHILDSTDPAQIRAIEKKIDLAHTLFFVSSKSGTTLEPNIFKQYFYDRAREAVGKDEAGNRFIAITDPGSKLREEAEAQHFRKIFLGVPSIGGRYSALSDFGLAPAAAMGIDIGSFLDRVIRMVRACGDAVARNNPGVILGAILGTAHNQGRDKVTIIASPAINDLGAWLEQLLAESTGKNGKGLIPVDREALGPPEVYGDDRLFIYLRLESAPDAAEDAAIADLRSAGQPIVMISIADAYDLGQEFFRWEIATAVAGSIIGINPFDQPDVQAAKDKTNEVLAGGDVELEPEGSLDELVAEAREGDYLCIQAFVDPARVDELQQLVDRARESGHVVTHGFGPRYLHSTGQFHKGGPNTGLFLQVVDDPGDELPIPGRAFGFARLIRAQAAGDYESLKERGRRVARMVL